MKFEIGEAARRAGVRPSAVRYYEKRGLIAAERGAGGRRLFTMESVERLVLIRHAKNLGFSLAEVRRLVMGEHWSVIAESKLVEVDRILQRTAEMREGLQVISRCQCRDLQQCAHAIASKAC